MSKIKKWLGNKPTLFSCKAYLYGIVMILEDENSSDGIEFDIGAHKRVGWLVSKIIGE